MHTFFEQLETQAAHTRPEKRLRMRLGVVLDGHKVPAWIYCVLEQLARDPSVELLLLPQDVGTLQPGVRGSKGPALFRLWARADRMVRSSRLSALKLREWRSLAAKYSLGIAPCKFRCDEKDGVGQDWLLPAGLDLILLLVQGAPTEQLCTSSRLGVWRLPEGVDGAMPAVPNAFWDMYEARAVTAAGPVIEHVRQGARKTIHRAAVVVNAYSLAMTTNESYWDLASALISLLARAEEVCAGGGEQERDDLAIAPDAVLSNAAMSQFLAAWGGRTVRHTLRKIVFREQWSLLLEAKTSCGTKSAGRTMLIPPRGSFYADPFVMDHGNRTYLFFEGYEFSARKGNILCSEIFENGRYSEPRKVLERPYHLSYPFVFEWNGSQYMIPETRDNSSIELYRAEQFPFRWVQEATLMSGVAAVDSTLVEHEGKWWLFTAGVLDHMAPERALWLYYADSPLGPWTSHAKNPIVTDPCCARPAGALFHEDGSLMRPGQDSSNGYGSATHLLRVDVLSETEYRETLVRSITPVEIPGSIGIHTFNQSARYRVMDCKLLILRVPFGLPGLAPGVSKPFETMVRRSEPQQ